MSVLQLGVPFACLVGAWSGVYGRVGTSGLQALSALALFGAAACVGRVEGRASGPSGTSGTSGSAGSALVGVGGGAGAGAVGGGGAANVSCVQGASFARARVTLLSDRQYRNVVRDVFGVTFPAAVDVTAAASASGSYSFNESAQVETTTVQAYQRAADQVAALLLAAPAAMAPCAAGAVDATCFQAF